MKFIDLLMVLDYRRIGDKNRTKTTLAVYNVVDTRLEQLGLVKDGRIVKVMP